MTYVAAALGLAFLGASAVWALVLYRLAAQGLPMASELLRERWRSQDQKVLVERLERLDADLTKLKEEQVNDLLSRRR